MLIERSWAVAKATVTGKSVTLNVRKPGPAGVAKQEAAAAQWVTGCPRGQLGSQAYPWSWALGGWGRRPDTAGSVQSACPSPFLHLVCSLKKKKGQ